MRLRYLKNEFFKGISYFAAVIAVFTLVLIIGKIFIGSLPSLNFDFLLTSESATGGLGGGVANAVVGTILLSILSPLIAAPLAVGTAVYLKRYARENFFTRTLSFCIDVLSGAPSIVVGAFGFLVLAIYLKPITGGFSLISGVIALAILILPVIEKATETAIDTVPEELEQASYALGATSSQTIRFVTLPYAMIGIISGIVLSIGRAAEESAIVVLTAGYSQHMPSLKIVPDDGLLFGLRFYPFQSQVATLPIATYHGFEFPKLVNVSESFAAAFILILIVMLINLGARLLLRRKRIG
jgi:phosphate transport system permease protein